MTAKKSDEVCLTSEVRANSNLAPSLRNSLNCTKYSPKEWIPDVNANIAIIIPGGIIVEELHATHQECTAND